MVEVGSRELKARLSYYLRLVEAGETVVIKIRNHIIAFLSTERPPQKNESHKTKKKAKDLERRIEQLKKEGFFISGGRFRYIPSKPVKMTPGPTSTEMIRKMRDEE